MALSKNSNGFVPEPIDFFILREFYKKKKLPGTFGLARRFEWDDKPGIFAFPSEEDEFYSKKANVIGNRFAIMQREGIAIIKQNGGRKKKELHLRRERVLFGKHKFADGYKDAVQIKDNTNKWVVYQL